MGPDAALAGHADWSIDPRKRWVSLARRTTRGWVVAGPRLVGEVPGFLPGLLAKADGGAVALGVDLPIGLPRAYAAGHTATGFVEFLRGTGRLPGFFSVSATLDQVCTERPFYPARGIAGMSRRAHALALGLADAAALSRLCDRATAERPAGAPLFWTLGANQSGKAAIAAWREMLIPALNDGAPIRLWPFQGPFLSLLAPGWVGLAETYPAEAMRHLGIRLRGSKRRQADRMAAGPALLVAMESLSAEPDDAMRSAVACGFGADATAEDRFDSALGLLCVLNVLAGNRPDTAPEDPWIQRWEGWVLGQTSLPVGQLIGQSAERTVGHSGDLSMAFTASGPRAACS